MGIPQYIKDVSEVVKRDEHIQKERSSYVQNFCEILHSKSRMFRLKPSHLKVFRKVYGYGIQLLEDRILMTCVRDQNAELTPIELEYRLREREFDFMDTFIRELETEESPDYVDSEFIAQSTGTGPHPIGKVLTMYSRQLTETLDTVGTTVLDVLAKNEVITESDEEVVASGHSRQERNNNLLSVLSTSPPEKDMGCFVDFLKDNHQPLGDQFSETFRQFALEPPDHVCAACTVVTMLDPSRIAKVLFERGDIPRNFYNDLRKPHLTTEDKWNLLRRKGLEEEAILALKPKYSHFFKMFKGALDLTCTCSESDISIPNYFSRGAQARASGSGSFKAWSTKTLNEENDEIKDKLDRLQTSVDDLTRTLHGRSLTDYEIPSRATSLQDLDWRIHFYEASGRVVHQPFHQNRGSHLNHSLSGAGGKHEYNIPVPREKKNIFSRIKQMFSKKKSRD